jgi:orotate phosphoribosyltransferase
MTNAPISDHEADPLAQDFVQFAVQAGVLRFGEFKTKAGRLSPYFFNAGLFDDGAKLGRLAEFYARRLLASGCEFDMLFGPAYKGITLAAAVAIELARLGRNVPFAYNRKEAKDHGEGGTLVGAPVQGPGADHRRRDLGRHLGARVDRDDHAPPAPRPAAWRLRWTARRRPPRTGADAPWSAVQYVQRRTSGCRWRPSPR